LIQAIHDSPGRTVMVIAGAGTHALAWLLGVAGASRTLLEALVPYDWAAFDDFLGQTPEQYVALPTARLMAGRALSRGRWLHAGETAIGLACTATIATDRPKRGPHRAHIATWQPGGVASYSLQLQKGRRDRSAEEDLVSRLILNALARAYGLDHRLTLPLITGKTEPGQPAHGDTCREHHADLARSARRLRQETISHFSISADGEVAENTDQTPIILSGAFNPLHEGHLELAKAAQGLLNLPITFELAARNVDKDPLSPTEVLERMAQFAGRWPVVASHAATFLEKARRFPQSTFVVGYDTAARIVHPRYYDDSQDQMRQALNEIRQRGCRFLVAGRKSDDGQFHPAPSLEIPAGFDSLFLPMHGFRHDISSSELRKRGARGSR
jgi:nicotinic acid mononucleotide adenylyltransferase